MPTLNWIGKEAVVEHHKEVPFHLLRCNPELSVGEPGSGNLLVQGDNLLALKALLPYYKGQVKCIYIDPPYNTGNESWVYNDNVSSPEIRAWLGQVVGREAEDLSRHDKWLCMMYPRLVLLREFLREDGLIFVSVDENEHRYAELMLEELFGRSNRIETIVWKKSYGGGQKSKHIVNLHEYIVCYARDIEQIPPLELPPDEKILKYYRYKDDKFARRGPYRLQPLATTSMDERPNLRYPIPYEDQDIWPEKQWQWSRERAFEALANDELVFRKSKGEWTVSYKQYLRNEGGEERKRKPYSIIDGIYTQRGTLEIRQLFGDGKAFSFPKPSELIKLLMQMSTSGDDIILDSFAGSGTTGHAVLKLNQEDGGNRRFILVEMEPEIARTIASERLKRAIEGYEWEGQRGKVNKEEGLGGGFRFCELGPTLFDAQGRIRDEVSFADLAHHVFFTETGEPLPGEAAADSPLLGTANGVAVYLLYNGILKDKSEDGGNVLTQAVLSGLPAHDGPKVVYGNGCMLSAAYLQREGITFRQIPYEIKIR
jgi:adenine-specific DNA-methyltransferase